MFLHQIHIILLKYDLHQKHNIAKILFYIKYIILLKYDFTLNT